MQFVSLTIHKIVILCTLGSDMRIISLLLVCVCVLVLVALFSGK